MVNREMLVLRDPGDHQELQEKRDQKDHMVQLARVEPKEMLDLRYVEYNDSSGNLYCTRELQDSQETKEKKDPVAHLEKPDLVEHLDSRVLLVHLVPLGLKDKEAWL